MRRLHIGLVGPGNFGAVYAAILKQTPGAELVSVCGRHPARTEAFATRFEVAHWCTDYHEMVSRDDLEAIAVVTTASQHAEITLAALEAGKHVIVEKPLALDLEGHDRVIETAERNHLTVLVGYIRRYDTRFLMLKEKLDKGELGDVVAVNSRRNGGNQMLETPRYAGTTTPLIIEPGIHAMDWLLWYGGAPAKTVYGVQRHLLGLSVADTYLATVTLRNGVVGTIEQVFFLPPRAPVLMDTHVEVIGTLGTGQISDPDRGFSIWDESSSSHPNAMLRAETHGDVHGALAHEIHDFVRCVLAGQRPLGASARDSRAALELGLAIVRSAETGRAVELDSSTEQSR
jgi:UDP-N-acetylglucosamine 3-dehydrogenase